MSVTRCGKERRGWHTTSAWPARDPLYTGNAATHEGGPDYEPLPRDVVRAAPGGCSGRRRCSSEWREERPERAETEQEGSELRVPGGGEFNHGWAPDLHVSSSESLPGHRTRFQRRYGDDHRHWHAERASEIGCGQRHLQQHEHGCRLRDVDGSEAVELQGLWDES